MHSLLRFPMLLCCFGAVLAAADDGSASTTSATGPVPVATWDSGAGVLAVAIAKPGATVAAGDYLMSASGTVHLKLIKSPHSTVDLAPSSEAYFEEKAVGDGTDLLIYLRKGSVEANIDAAPYREVHVLSKFVNASTASGYLSVTRDAAKDHVALALGSAHVDVSDDLAIALGHPAGADLGVRDEVTGTANGLSPVEHLAPVATAAPAVPVVAAPAAVVPAPAAPGPVATAPDAAPVATAPTAPSAPIATNAPVPAAAPAAAAEPEKDDGTPKLDRDLANEAGGEIGHETTTVLATEVEHHIDQGPAKNTH